MAIGRYYRIPVSTSTRISLTSRVVVRRRTACFPSVYYRCPGPSLRLASGPSRGRVRRHHVFRFVSGPSAFAFVRREIVVVVGENARFRFTSSSSSSRTRVALVAYGVRCHSRRCRTKRAVRDAGSTADAADIRWRPAFKNIPCAVVVASLPTAPRRRREIIASCACVRARNVVAAAAAFVVVCTACTRTRDFFFCFLFLFLIFFFKNPKVRLSIGRGIES